ETRDLAGPGAGFLEDPAGPGPVHRVRRPGRAEGARHAGLQPRDAQRTHSCSPSFLRVSLCSSSRSLMLSIMAQSLFPVSVRAYSVRGSLSGITVRVTSR